MDIREYLRPLMRLKRDRARRGFKNEYARIAVYIGLLTFCLLFWFGVIVSFADEVKVDLHKIMMIESGGRNIASSIKSEHAKGIFQITPICLKEYNNFHPNGQYSSDDLWNTSISRKIADWYINKRIPQMIRHFKKPVTIENIIIAYNAGITYVKTGREIPVITKRYIKKYRGMK